MKQALIGLGTIAGILIVSLIMILLETNVGDLIFSMLSASVAGFMASLYFLSNGASVTKVVLVLSASIGSSIVGWLFAQIVLRITTVSLYDTTAMAFDYMVGIISALVAIVLMYEKQLSEK